MILRNWASASSMPAAVQRRHMSPFCQRLTLRLVRRTHSIIDSHGFVEASVRLSYDLFAFARSPSDAPQPVSVRTRRRVHHDTDVEVPLPERANTVPTDFSSRAASRV